MYNHPLASSMYVMHCVKRFDKCPNFTQWIQSRRVIRNRWPLVECITMSPSQWRQCETVVWLVLGGWQVLLLIGREQLPKRDQNETKMTLATTASATTSNVTSSCAYRTMGWCYYNGPCNLRPLHFTIPFLDRPSVTPLSYFPYKHPILRPPSI